MSFSSAFDTPDRHHRTLWLVLGGSVLVFVPMFLLLRGDRAADAATPSTVTRLSLVERGMPFYDAGEPPEAVKRYFRGETAEAITKLELALSDPTQKEQLPLTLYYLGRAYADAGRGVEAEQLHTRLLTDHAASPFAGDALAMRAARAKEAGNAAQLAEINQLIADRHPTSHAAQQACRDMADEAERRGDLAGALRAHSGLVRGAVDPTVRAAAVAKAQELARAVIYSDKAMAGARFHEVKAGETLGKIAKLHGSSVGLLRRINTKKDDRIFIGERLKILGGKFEITVHKSQFQLTLFIGELYLVHFPVGLGEGGKTPKGTFVINSKLENPPWYWGGQKIPYGDPRHKIGSRWMGFAPKPGATGFGIHGTSEPDSIGKNLSAGCVRMANPQVEELFEMVPMGTTVDILD